MLQLGRRDWVARRTPIREAQRVVGAVIALYDAASIEEAGSSLRAQRKGRLPRVARHTFDDLHGGAPALRAAVDMARRYAATELAILIGGESGTGKELMAQAIHHASARAGRPFVALNCSALPESPRSSRRRTLVRPASSPNASHARTLPYPSPWRPE